MPQLSERPIFCPLILGRDQVLDTLDQHLKQAREGSCQILVLAGEAGIGKSRLVAEAKARATGAGMSILEGRCFETDQAAPYAPILDLFRTFKAEHSMEALERVVSGSTPGLAWILPELAAMQPAAQAPAPLAGESKLTLFESITQVLLRLATRAPVLLILEDLHWSDDISLELLIYAVRRLAAQRILFLLTFRGEEPNPSLNHLIATLDRSRLVTEIVLTRLTQDQVALMIRVTLRLERPIPLDILEVIYNLSEGNPFFVEEVLKSLVVAGTMVPADGQWDRRPISEWHLPRSVQETVQRRVEQVSAPARRVLKVAAIAGRQFDFMLLQAVLGTDEQELLELITELVAAQLVVEESANRYSFRHAFTRLAVHNSLLRREQQRLHQAIAETQERLLANSITSHLPDLSLHFFEGGIWHKAFEYSARAGEQAQALYAPREAIDHFTRAIKSAQALEVSPPARLYRARGQAYETVGDLRAASTDYAVVLAAARETGDRFAQAQCLLDLGFVWAARDYSKAGEYFQRALALARSTGDPGALARGLNRIGNWHTNVGEHLEAIQQHEEALSIFESLGDRHGLAQTLDLLGLAHLDASDLIQGAAYLERSTVLSRELDDRPGLSSSLATMTMSGLHSHCDTLVLASRANENIERAGAALKIAREIGWRAGEAYALLELGFCWAPRGEFAAAIQAASNAVAIAEEIEHTEWLVGGLCSLGAAKAELFDLPSARRHLERALQLAGEIGSRIWLPTVTGFLAQVYIEQNDMRLAESILDVVLGPTSPTRTRAQRFCWCMRAEIALEHEDAAQALEIADQLIASTPQRTEITVIPRLWSLRARALGAQRHYSEAERLLLAAEETAFSQGAQSLLWRIHLALGELYRLRGRRDDASNQFDDARRIVQNLATRVLDQSLRENFLVRAQKLIPRGGQLSARQTRKNEYAGLTSREREVASLIARGKSNREIAQSLVVTERTVGAHVGNILAKLGLTSRTQIAAWAIEKGLQAPE